MLELHAGAIWAFGIVQLLGWMCGLLARFSGGSRHQTTCHAFFMLALLVVGAFTALALFLGAWCWLLSAATLAGMILLAICDFDRTQWPATI